MITYIKGDATAPIDEGPKVIIHVCNDIGAWGKGFVLAISKRWSEPKARYREWSKNKIGFKLGAVQFVEVEDDLHVANMIGQHGIYKQNGVIPLRYKALEKCLEKADEFAKEEKATIHMPRIGCGLAGGDWDKVEELINKVMSDVEVTVYDWDGR